MTDKNSIQIIDKLARNRIFISRYWKEECFALNAQTIIDKTFQLKTVGGLYGGAKKPTKFMCLLLKMLQMNLPKEIALEYLKARQYKYLTALTLMYLRLTVKGAEVYELLEPFYNDNRKLVMKDFIGRHEIIYVDEFVDKLLTEEVVMGIVLPFLPKRMVFEEQGIIEERVSILEQGMEGEMGEIENENEGEDENQKGEGEEKQEERMNLMIEEEDEEEQDQ